MKDKFRLRQRLKDGEVLLGTWCDLPSLHVVNVLSRSGLDFIIIDMEHGPIYHTRASEMMMAAEADNCAPLVRVSGLNEQAVLRTADTGVPGIIFPHICTEENRKQAVELIKFLPAGNRGFNPFCRYGNYGDLKEGTEAENRRILTCLIIEDRSGIDDIESILDDPDVDVIYIGVYDLSVALGMPGKINDPAVMEMFDLIVRKVRDKGKVVGAMAHSKDDIEKSTKKGVQFIAYKVDTAVLYESYHSVVEFLKRMSGGGKNDQSS